LLSLMVVQVSTHQVPVVQVCHQVPVAWACHQVLVASACLQELAALVYCQEAQVSRQRALEEVAASSRQEMVAVVSCQQAEASACLPEPGASAFHQAAEAGASEASISSWSSMKARGACRYFEI
jgi:hypothetical protein